MRSVTILIAALASAGAFACGPSTTWRGRAFQEIRSLRDLPDTVRQGLFTERPGTPRMADADEPFNRSDAIENPEWPMRRFAIAARSGDMWVVAYEQGGFAPYTQLLLFASATPVPEDLGTHSKRPRSLQELLAILPRLNGRADR